MLKLSTWIPNLTPDEHHRLKMRLNVILYSMLGLSVVLLQLRNPMNQATALIGIGLMSLSLILVRRDYLSFPRVAVPVVFWAVMTTFMANGSGLRDVAIYGYFIVIVMSGLLLGQDTIWAAMSLCILSVFGILAAEQSDLIHTAQHGNYDISEAIYISAYLLFSTILLRMVISSLNKSLAVARFNEQALGALNASLETRIQERTQQAETARQHSDRLFQAGRSINATNSHLELVNAIAAYINHPGYDVVISTYENFDKTGATYYTLLAGKIAGQQEAQMLGVNLPVLDGFTIALDELYSDSDVAAHPEDTRSVYLQAQGVVSAMAVGLYVGHRYLGNLSISTREKHHFSPEEGQLLLGLADLTAAAVDRIRLYDEQVKTAEELRALDMMKSQFLASMSHELRTPLNAILNFTEFMLVGMLGPTTDKQKDALQKTLGSGKHLLSLINDVLDMTKIQSGMMNLFIEDEVDLDKELHQVIATAESMLNGRPVRFIQ
jgi:GAF domain-containing protein